jgi:WhiB family redox-sensing transcriptional regulator
VFRTVEIVLIEPHLTEPPAASDGDLATLIDINTTFYEIAYNVSTPAFSPMTGRARCSDGAGTLTHLFFSDDDHEVARAKAICRSCPLAESCLDGALERQEAYGVWGGVLLIEGEPSRFPRRRGRPPTRRIEVVAEEVEIPAHLVA